MAEYSTINASRITNIVLVIIMFACTALILEELAVNIIAEINYHKNSVIPDNDSGRVKDPIKLKEKSSSEEKILPETRIGF